ncbi:MAG: hypothetical protein ABJL18_06885 [Hyphomicrobiales bacterium]
MSLMLKSMAAVVSAILLVGCGPLAGEGKPELAVAPTDSTTSGSALAALQPGTTWVAYEIRKAKITLVPSYCAAEPFLIYTAPTVAEQNGVCVYTDELNDGTSRPKRSGEIMGFNPPGSSGRISQGKRLKIQDNSVEAKVFQLFSVAPGRYFHGLVGFQNTLRPLDGTTPYFDIQAGKINYVGSYNVPLGADLKWEPDALLQALASNEPSFDLSAVNTQVPRRGEIKCLEPEKPRFIVDINPLKRTKCFLTLRDESYIR